MTSLRDKAATGRGKISTLPYEQRVEINRMIRDERPYDEIAARCAELGAADVSPQNISAYKAGSYQRWRRNIERIERMRDSSRLARELAADEAGDMDMVSNRVARIAIDNIEQVLEEFDPATLRDLIGEEPKKFFALVDAIGVLRRGDRDMARLQMELDRHKSEMRTIAADAKRRAAASGDGDLAAIADQMQRVLGM